MALSDLDTCLTRLALKKPMSTLSCDGVSIEVLRLDTLDELGSGNKLFKLWPFLKLAEHLTCKESSAAVRLLSFGGMQSNHLHAMAYYAKQCGFAFTAVVRGFEGVDYQSESGSLKHPVLSDIKRWGGDIQCLPPAQYALRSDLDTLRSLHGFHAQNGEYQVVVPEGGSTQLLPQFYRQSELDVFMRAQCVVQQHLAQVLEAQLVSLTGNVEFAGVDAIKLYVPCGTGAFSRLIASILSTSQAAGQFSKVSLIAVDVVGEISATIEPADGFKVLNASEQSRFGKLSPILLTELAKVYDDTGLMLDPVYGIKALDCLLASIDAGDNARHVLIHTGGVQGIRGYRGVLERALRQVRGSEQQSQLQALMHCLNERAAFYSALE